jgi:hypothetical protein
VWSGEATVTAVAAPDPIGPTTVPDPGRSGDGARTLLLVGAGYLGLALGLWWNVWSSHPTSTTTCGCGDAARFLWFFEWPAYALAHGHHVLYSTWLFHPGGINLLDDTSVVALSVILAPVTWTLGPVASMNVALTLAPALSALAMFALLRRWVAWTPAAVFGGVVYGFSPFVVTELALNQINIAFLAVPPLIVLVLGDLLITQERPPWRNGLTLAALVVVQFFLSTEVLLITAMAALIGVALLVGWTAVTAPAALGPRVGAAARGSAVAVGASVAVLAYPLWFLLAGPAHLVGPIWSVGGTARYGTTWSSFAATAGLASLRPSMLRFGGYQGPVLVGLGYLGLGVLMAAVVGVVVWRQDRKLLLFGAVGLVSALLSLGPGHGTWVPWTTLQHVPWVGDIVEVRFTLVVALCVAVMAALALDRTHRWLQDRTSGSRWAGSWSWMLTALVLLPTVSALGPQLPLTVRPVVLPRWYTDRGPELPPGSVVLAYPVPFSGFQSSEAWQAVTAMPWEQAGGGGPQGQPSRAGAARPGFEVLVGASLPLGPAPEPTPANVTAVRQALALWQVSTMVVPDRPGLPVYEQGRSIPYALGFLTAVLGAAPTHAHSAWVWNSVRTAPAPVPVVGGAFARCTSGPAASATGGRSVPRCILDAGVGGTGA